MSKTCWVKRRTDLEHTDKDLPAVRVGFMPLTDCASVVVAAARGFDRKYGIRIVLSRESSWAGVRDKLGAGDLDAAHALYGMLYGVQMGIGCFPRPMAVLMNLSRNGQGITLSRALGEQGVHDGASLAALVKRGGRPYTFGQTFPTGNHAMLLNYWLAAHGIDPLRDVNTITVPPSQMVASLRAGHIDGFCAGEPWGQRAAGEGIGASVASSAQVWRDHPGKALGATAAYALRHPERCRALVAAVLEASRWIESSSANREQALQLLAGPDYLNTELAVLRQPWDQGEGVRYFDGGKVNMPYLSDGMWFMTQHRRWGLLRQDPDYLAVASAVNRVDLYTQGAELAGVAVPPTLVRSAILVDGVAWDGSDPAAYAGAFSIRHASFSGVHAPECGVTVA
jgi:ABC-type nitrate/sulfonate/bicarbonate transport system substrate-binding protein